MISITGMTYRQKFEKKRVCLICDKEFTSKNVFNRTCYTCKRRERQKAGSYETNFKSLVLEG